MSGLPMAMPDHPSSSYRVCSTVASLTAAVDVLSEHSHIFLDCEGRTLGLVGGKLSLLNLGVVDDTEDGEQHLSIFVIDILAFQGARSHHLIPVFDILKSEEVFKVVFDGRMDASELLHGHGVQLLNVLDLQVADILSREKRGEDVDQQLQRLAGFLPKSELGRNPSFYYCVQKLNGMASAMREHGIEGGKKRDVDHSKWIKRPMNEASLLYAAEDICKIQQLYDVFVEEGYIDEETLVQQSASYMYLHAKVRPIGGKYQTPGLFPLAVFLKTPTDAPTQCRGCERSLPETCFTRSAARGKTRKICFVCRAIDTNEQLCPKWRRK